MYSKYPRMPERIKTGCGDYTYTKKERQKKKKQWFLVTAGALIVNSHMVTS